MAWTVVDMIFKSEGPSTQYLRSLVLKTIACMVVETRVLKIGYLHPLGKTLPSDKGEANEVTSAFPEPCFPRLEKSGPGSSRPGYGVSKCGMLALNIQAPP